MDNSEPTYKIKVGIGKSIVILMISGGIFIGSVIIATILSSNFTTGFFGPRNHDEAVVSEAIMAPIVLAGLGCAIYYAIKQFAKTKHLTAYDRPVLAGLWRGFWICLILLAIYDIVFGILYVSTGYDLQTHAIPILALIGIIGIVGGLLRTIDIKKNPKPVATQGSL